MRRVWRGALMLLGIASSQGAFAQEGTNAPPLPYAQPGTEARLGLIVEQFLGVAKGLAQEPEVFNLWCRQYRIDPTWPSAHRLGSVISEVQGEYVSRLKEARHTSTFTTADGLDPNDWKNEAIGRAFGEVYEALRLDGWDMEIGPFLDIIQAQTAPAFSTFSDEPFTQEKMKYRDSLFWKGLTGASIHARELQAERGVQ